MDSKKGTKDKSLIVATQALNKNMFTEFVLYEVILPKDPYFVFSLSKEDCASIVQYVKNIRSNK